MRAGHKLQAVVVVEHLADVLTKGVTGTTGADAPANAVIGIAPQQIAHRALVGNLLSAVDLADLIQRVDRRRQTSVQAKHLSQI